MKQWVRETVPGLLPKRDKGVSHDCFISKHCFKMKLSRETHLSRLEKFPFAGDFKLYGRSLNVSYDTVSGVKHH